MTLPSSPMELLAPAGTIDAFEAAIEAGADAVYIGAPSLSARASARDFTLGEMDSMLTFAKARGVKVSLAINSLMLEKEIDHGVEMLASFDALGGHAVIVQDLGVYRLARRFFPKLRLHASTLMGAYNSLAVQTFQKMGFNRVVLPRELMVEEIAAIHAVAGEVELEVFAHGAMCFGYSGLCYFSSFLGGKSGLRGRCVQPCRRRYRLEQRGRGKAEESYLFSMNDLSTIDCLDKFAAAGVVSLKIEGRMRSATYVASAVRAYRLALDALREGKPPPPEAYAFLEAAMGRKTGRGYYFSAPGRELLSPQHSGNIGVFLGKVHQVKNTFASVRLLAPVKVGDRLRLHQEENGDRHSFSLKVLSAKGKPVMEAGKGAQVMIESSIPCAVGDSFYKVDEQQKKVRTEGEGAGVPRGRSLAANKKRAVTEKKAEVLAAVYDALPKKKPALLRVMSAASRTPPGGQRKKHLFPGEKKQPSGGQALAWWLKGDDLRAYTLQLGMSFSRFVLVLTPKTYSQFMGGGKTARQILPRLIWGLPPVIDEKHLLFYREAIALLISRRCHAWQLTHAGQLGFFNIAQLRSEIRPSGENRSSRRAAPLKLTLYGDYPLNIMNSQAAATLVEAGLEAAQVSVELDRTTMAQLLNCSPLTLGATVYYRPILSMARATGGFFPYDSTVVSPKGEGFQVKRVFGKTVVMPDKTVSLLGEIEDLGAMGLGYVVIDISGWSLGRQEQRDLTALLTSSEKRQRYSTFNYHGTLL